MPLPNKIPALSWSRQAANQNADMASYSITDLLALNNLHFATKYADLATAISTIGATETTLVIEDSEAITSDLTIPATIALLFLRGGDISIASAKTLTINGPCEIGLHQAFSGDGTVVFGDGMIEWVYPQWWGALGDGSNDDTTAVQAALDCVSGYNRPKLGMFLPSGVYKLTDTLVVRNPAAGQHRGGWTLKGNGYNSVLYQTGSGKTGLEIGNCAGETPAMEGVTIADLSIVGTTGTLYGLYINEVVRSHFSNLHLMADEADLAIKGAVLNTWSGIHLSYAAFNENPIAGITIPTTRNYGLKTLADSMNSYTTQAWLGLVVEGHTTGGMYVEGGSTNTYANLCIEGEGGYGIYSSAEWDSFNGVYMEAITGDGFTLLNTQKVTVSNLFMTTPKFVLSNASYCTFVSCGVGEWEANVTSAHNTWIDSSGDFSLSGGDHAGEYMTTINSALAVDVAFDPVHFGFTAGGLDIVGNSYMWKQVQHKQYYQQSEVYKHRAIPGDIVYNHYPTAGNSPGDVCITRIDTAIRVQAVATDTIIEVDATAGILAGDIIGIVLDNSVGYATYHWTTVAGITDADTLVITAGIPAGRTADVSDAVYTNRWKAMSPLDMSGSILWNPGNLVDGAGETSGAITVTGAALGDFVLVSAPYDLQDCVAIAYVQAANTVEIRLQNESGGAKDLIEGTWQVKVIKP